MYYERLPVYVYDLPCGHTFRSLTRSEAVTGEAGEPDTGDTEDGAHFFYCGHCKTHQVVEPGELVERAPTKFPGNQSKVVDQAIRLDRIRLHFLTHWDAVKARDIAAQFSCSESTVTRVARDLGVYT